MAEERRAAMQREQLRVEQEQGNQITTFYPFHSHTSDVKFFKSKRDTKSLCGNSEQEW